MKKVYIVMDEPESCDKCQLFGEMVCHGLGWGINNLFPKGFKQEFCPLKPLPEKQEIDLATCSALNFTERDMDMATGWNACIDRILEGGD